MSLSEDVIDLIWKATDLYYLAELATPSEVEIHTAEKSGLDYFKAREVLKKMNKKAKEILLSI